MMIELCDCCGNPGGICRSCGASHHPLGEDGCEACAPSIRQKSKRWVRMVATTEYHRLYGLKLGRRYQVGLEVGDGRLWVISHMRMWGGPVRVLVEKDFYEEVGGDRN